MSILILAALLFVMPQFSGGPYGDFLIKSQAKDVVVIVNDRVEGSKACYVVVYPTNGTSFVRNDTTGTWGKVGVRCQIESRLDDGWVRLSIVFNTSVDGWTGPRNVYVLERPDGLIWYKAGIWNIQPDNDIWPRLPTMLPNIETPILTPIVARPVPLVRMGSPGVLSVSCLPDTDPVVDYTDWTRLRLFVNGVGSIELPLSYKDKVMSVIWVTSPVL